MSTFLSHTGPSNKTRLVRIGDFQPFASRRGVDTVLRISFDYDLAVIATLKKIFAEQKPRVIDPARQIHAAGGFLPKQKCWFCESACWPEVRQALGALAHVLVST